ncbi:MULTISPECIES: NAD-dependent epimerase/dehydratase family protein [Streptomyces]|uniref:NAD-dependent epimerase/dehydratase family protein n=2 Tax=Streptomyces TaxID=1883 RepID=A0A3R7ERE0_9ACTN|nr:MULTISPECIES: NAD-dependent epimerase/dehydratase family protein [Streptomyces]KNE81199.1 NAD-dependent dehydratase [Streptomyces fradiae]PQM19393.1 NAD-dependent dehydratase [Streptomyces xinghaiensis]RKM94538.1 NAD-dependent epimerase/dehydratase family protein [Streptomyces xinghaiensis]RNC72137.1 NAD-dependent epimerase/dehydratase family protein [Streptomyces xinghaiensis]
MGKVVLVTGAGRQLAGRFVRRVQREPDVARVIAVDSVPPERHLGGAEFIQADIRQPTIARVLAEYAVDTVVHLDVTGTPAPTFGVGSAKAPRGRATLKETNVIGTMQLLGACQKAPSVQRLVVKSSTNVYGSAPRDPAVFDESTPPKSLPSGGFAKDTVEVEGYVRGFARRRPDVAVCVLRFANILGPYADTPLAEYFSLPVLPTVLGYDPRLQFVHEDDVMEVLRIASSEPRRGTLNSGTFNIAGDGVLLLSQTARRLGKPTLPLLLPALTWVRSALRVVGMTDFSPEQVRLLTHGRVVRTAEMRQTLGFEPAYTTAETFADFARSRQPGLLPPERLAHTVDRLAEALLDQPADAAGGDGHHRSHAT